MRIFLILFFCGTIFASCSSVIPTLSFDNVGIVKSNYPDFTKEDFILARDAFITRCSGCHNLPSPKTHTKYEWKALLPEMLNDSKATENEKELITKFIISFSKN
ncbi:MAG: hypothetical protein AAB255_06635 [Bacteroidota bacterium]